MIQSLKKVSFLALVALVLGAFSVYSNGNTIDLAMAQDAPPPDCCDAPPPD